MLNKFFKVAKTIHETSDIFTLRLEPVDGQSLDFLAGQFINVFQTGVELKPGERPQMRSYSISSSPFDKAGFEITVKRKGSFSIYLESLKISDQVKITGPLGIHFTISEKTTQDVVMIAGGVGVTPFKSMSAAACAFGKKSWVFYSTKKKEDLVFIDFFEKLAFKNKDNFFFEYTLTQPPQRWNGRAGRFTLDEINSTVGGLENKLFFICGPKAMADDFSAQLLAAGVAEENIKAEGWG